MTSPTEAANVKFRSASRSALSLMQTVNPGQTDLNGLGATVVNLGYAISELSKGMKELSTGLRATYILLEQVQKSIPKGFGR
jgi:hypothetical protein